MWRKSHLDGEWLDGSIVVFVVFASCYRVARLRLVSLSSVITLAVAASVSLPDSKAKILLEPLTGISHLGARKFGECSNAGHGQGCSAGSVTCASTDQNIVVLD